MFRRCSLLFLIVFALAAPLFAQEPSIEYSLATSPAGEVQPVGHCESCAGAPACGCAATPCDCSAPCNCAVSACQCAKGACGCGKAGGAKKPNPCATSHKPLFYNNDFSYLNNPNYHGHCLGDHFKQIPIGCEGKLDIGGQLRLRYHHEVGMKGPQRFLDTVDDFLLTRLRLYTNYKVNPWLRLYVEGILAESSFESYPPRQIDENQGDLLNAFVDLQVFDEVGLRVGRQELLYGNQRLVSPLDWANTRRTFDGVKVMTKFDDWTADLFYTNPVIVAPYAFDEPDYDQSFYGMYSVYSGWDNNTLDLFYLGYDDQTNLFSIHTVGGRLNGGKCDWLWELEGGYQFGDASGVGVGQSAGYCTGGIGRKMSDMEWKPTLWLYMDYASGDTPGGDFNGFNQLFPLAHKYLGFIDAVQRSNIQSPNVLLTASPTDKLDLLLWYYYFQSDTAAPVPSIGGTPNQNGGRYFGQELDLIAKYKLRPRSEILFGYSHFWRGSKIENPNDADFFYCEFTVNF